MNTTVTSKETILEISRDLVLKGGFSAISMRAIASRCNIAVGSIYNYFPSKALLLTATIEKVWEEIFAPLYQQESFRSFPDCISCMFDTIRRGDQKYPGFFSVHSLNFASADRKQGKEMMERFFDTLKETLLLALKNDPKVRPEIFEKHLSRELFVDYIFTLMVSLLLKKQEHCTPLLEMIESCIYENPNTAGGTSPADE